MKEIIILVEMIVKIICTKMTVFKNKTVIFEIIFFLFLTSLQSMSNYIFTKIILNISWNIIIYILYFYL
jgi:hypothetical protein